MQRTIRSNTAALGVATVMKGRELKVKVTELNWLFVSSVNTDSTPCLRPSCNAHLLAVNSYHLLVRGDGPNPRVLEATDFFVAADRLGEARDIDRVVQRHDNHSTVVRAPKEEHWFLELRGEQ